MGKYNKMLAGSITMPTTVINVTTSSCCCHGNKSNKSDNTISVSKMLWKGIGNVMQARLPWQQQR